MRVEKKNWTFITFWRYVKHKNDICMQFLHYFCQEQIPLRSLDLVGSYLVAKNEYIKIMINWLIITGYIIIEFSIIIQFSHILTSIWNLASIIAIIVCIFSPVCCNFITLDWWNFKKIYIAIFRGKTIYRSWDMICIDHNIIAWYMYHTYLNIMINYNTIK